LHHFFGNQAAYDLGCGIAADCGKRFERSDLFRNGVLVTESSKPTA
jgi:hypothetical protein